MARTLRLSHQQVTALYDVHFGRRVANGRTAMSLRTLGLLAFLEPPRRFGLTVAGHELLTAHLIDEHGEPKLERRQGLVVAPKPAPSPTADVRVEYHGTVTSFALRTQAGKDWVQQNVQLQGWQWTAADQFAVDSRFVAGLITGMRDGGLEVSV